MHRPCIEVLSLVRPLSSNRQTPQPLGDFFARAPATRIGSRRHSPRSASLAAAILSSFSSLPQPDRQIPGHQTLDRFESYGSSPKSRQGSGTLIAFRLRENASATAQKRATPSRSGGRAMVAFFKPIMGRRFVRRSVRRRFIRLANGLSGTLEFERNENGRAAWPGMRPRLRCPRPQ